LTVWGRTGSQTDKQRARRKVEMWTGWGRIGRQTDRQRAGRKAERWIGWGRQGKGRRISIKMDRIGQNR
jgi:hypothetical protein